MTDDLGTLYTIWQNDNSSVGLMPECAPLVERAMKLWAERRQDTWLGLEMTTGADYCVLASTITSSLITTPEQRAAAHVRDKACEDERAEFRRLAGFIESE